MPLRLAGLGLPDQPLGRHQGRMAGEEAFESRDGEERAGGEETAVRYVATRGEGGNEQNSSGTRRHVRLASLGS